MRIAYADPPYPGQAHLYRRHRDYAGEVDHAELIARLERDFDACVLHTSAPALRDVLPLCPASARILAWCKPFCSWKRGQWPAYAWEPVIAWGGRERLPSGLQTPRDFIRTTPADEEAALAEIADWLAEPIATLRGLAGAKPRAVVWWALDCLRATHEDDVADLFPGTGAVTAAWQAWRRQPRLDAFGPTIDTTKRLEEGLWGDATGFAFDA